MKLVKVAAAIVNQIPLAWEHNKKNIIDCIEAARADGVTLICFPELCIPGYGAEDAFYSHHTIERSWQVLEELLPHTKGIAVSVGLPTLFKNGLFNTACMIVDGEIEGLVAKQHLAGDGIYYEPRWFRAWPEGVRREIRYKGALYPIGDLFFEVGGVKIGYEICEDAWVADRPGARLAMHGIDVILNPSGSHFAFGKYDVRGRFVLEGSRAFGVTYVYSNLLGNEAGRAIYDGGAMIASGGSMIAMGPRFSYRDWDFTSAVVDVEATRMMRARTGSYKPSFDKNPAAEVNVPGFDFPDIEPVSQEIEQADWEDSDFIKEEEFTRAVSLALFDYLRKSWSRGFVVSLSGGADSAAVSTLSALALQMGALDIGIEDLKKKLHYIRPIQGCETVDEMVKYILTCAYQATENSGDITRTAAEEVAKALGAEYFELDVDSLYKGYVGLIERALDRDLTWESDDITLQNVQARVRSPSIWMFANIRGALLLSTSNRSEAAVGYATMDGDTSGGVSPIAGIDKAFLRQWLSWMELHGPLGYAPMPSLSYINAQQPTAELRPQEAAQTDEGDLMPYELLDAIERVAIRDKKAPVDVYRIMHERFPRYDPHQLHVWVERFFKLWSRNQWKRERYAPSFHLDDENLDPKTWCRWPILSGGFKEDLGDLGRYVSETFGAGAE